MNMNMNMTKKQTILWILLSITVIGALSLTYLYDQGIIFSKKEEEKVIITERITSLTYKGSEGKTALELLRNKAQIVTSGEGENAFVTSINGVIADSSKEYWSLSINGEPSMVGAGSYITKDGDVIKWDLITF